MSTKYFQTVSPDFVGYRVVCAWCGKVLKEGTPGARVSHGICNRCMHRELAQAQSFVNFIPAPALAFAR